MTVQRLPLLARLDTGLVKGLVCLLAALKNATLWLLGLLSLLALPALALEYDEGLADLSGHEWASFLLLALLLCRHVRYCRLFAYGFWRGLGRLLMFQGVLSCALLALAGAVLALLLESEQLYALLAHLRLEDPTSKLLVDAGVLLAVFLAPPTRARQASGASQAGRVEPTVSGEAQP